jgi:hypothetical protein
MAHLMRVTGMSREEATDHFSAAKLLCGERSRYTWELDLSLLTDNGINVIKPVAREDRMEFASKRLLEETMKESAKMLAERQEVDALEAAKRAHEMLRRVSSQTPNLVVVDGVVQVVATSQQQHARSGPLYSEDRLARLLGPKKIQATVVAMEI